VVLGDLLLDLPVRVHVLMGAGNSAGSMQITGRGQQFESKPYSNLHAKMPFDLPGNH